MMTSIYQQQTAAVLRGRATAAIPVECFSPLSSSLSPTFLPQGKQPQDPPQRTSATHTQCEAEVNRLLSFEQEQDEQEDVTLKSTVAEQGTPVTMSATKTQIQELEDLLQHIDSFSFSPSPSAHRPSRNLSTNHQAVFRERTNILPATTSKKVISFARDPSGVANPGANYTATPAKPAIYNSSIDNGTNDDTSSLVSSIRRPTANGIRYTMQQDPEPTIPHSITDDDPVSPVLGTPLIEDNSPTRRTSNHFSATPAVHSRSVDQFQTPGRASIIVPPDELSANEVVMDDSIFSTSSQAGFSSALSHPVSSPENNTVKHILKTAVAALQDAREERESARKWANQLQTSVQNWAEEQRKLIRCEATTRKQSLEEQDELVRAHATSLHKLDQAIHLLCQELQSSHDIRKDEQDKLEQLLLQQQEAIHNHSNQITGMEKKWTESIAGSGGGTLSKGSFTKGIQPAGKVPRWVGDTAKDTDDARSQKSTGSASTRMRKGLPNGAGHVVVYGNGITKEVHADGTIVVRFTNGDIETKFPDSEMVAYFHASERVMQITTKDGSVLYEYPNHQIERHYADGSKTIIFPDGVKQRVDANGVPSNVDPPAKV